jgi:hypothetical protein
VRENPDGPFEAVPASSFSVRDYARTAVGSHRSTLDVSSFASAPLKPTTLRALRYAAALESDTMGHLRNVLVTATHKDARVTAFLGTWAFEKFWIADALQLVIDAHEGVALPEPRRSPAVLRLGRELRERARPITGSVRAARLGEDMVAVHMTVGTIDEWFTQAALERIAELDPNPALGAVIKTLVGIKRRQLEFFEAQARDRLAASATTRSVVRRLIARTPVPVGAGAPSETAFYLHTLFAGAPVLVRSIDTDISSLPGQEGLHLIERAVAPHRSGRTSGGAR